MVEAKIKAEIGMEPNVVKPVGSYIPASNVGNVVYTSGQLPMKEGKLMATGKVGKEVTVEQAQELAKIAAFNALGAIKSVAGNLDNVDKILKLTVFVNSAPGFTAQPAVANGASDFFVKIFGENGKHARSAVGVAELPLNAPVELEVVASLKKI